MMEAWADADKGSSRMALYCDTENGFRVMFLPHRALMAEGPAQLSLTIDGAKPIVMGDNRDNSTDSRVAREDGGVGFIPAENLVARADVMLGSYDYLNARGLTSWLGQIRLSRFLRSI